MILQRIRKSLECQKGFTLMELMVVIAIIGVLVAIALPKMSQSTKSAKIATAKANIRTVMGALEAYAADHEGKYPKDAVAASATDVPTDLENYLKKWPAHIKYTAPTATAEYKLEAFDSDNTTTLKDNDGTTAITSDSL